MILLNAKRNNNNFIYMQSVSLLLVYLNTYKTSQTGEISILHELALHQVLLPFITQNCNITHKAE